MGLLTERSEDDDERGDISIAGLDGLDVGPPEEMVYDLDGWNERSRTALRERLETLGLPHRWEELELVIAADNEAWLERVMDQVEDELSLSLDMELEHVAYDLTEWDAPNRESLFDLLDAEAVAFGMDGDELFVHAIDELRVDELIESMIGTGTEAVVVLQAGPEVMGELFVAADRLVHDPLDPEGMLSLIAAIRATEGLNPPYGMDKVWWDGVLGHTEQLVTLFDAPASDEPLITDAATALRDALRPYV